MKKTIIILTTIALLACNQTTKNKPPQQTADNIEYQSDSTKINPDKKLKHLIASNGGLIGFFNDNTVVGCPRCDYVEENVNALYSIQPHATYTEFPACLLCDNGNKEEFFDEHGNIGIDWAIINYHKIAFREQLIYFQPYSNSINPDSIQIVKNTCLIEFMPETKHFDDEESEEAENYFTAMDNLMYYMYETSEKFKNIGIESIVAKKRYLLFDIENNEQIIVDSQTRGEQNSPMLLYKKGKIPIVIHIALPDMELAKEYLR